MIPLGPAHGLTLAALTVSVPADYQQPPLITVGAATETLSPPFTRIHEIREIGSGRVAVLDHGERMVFLVDLGTRQRRGIGRPGAGPGEYLLPARLFALPGDSTAVLDEALRRLLILDPSGRPVAVRPVHEPASAPMVPARVSAIDSSGRLYGIAQPLAASALGLLQVADSAAIERWILGSTTRDTIGYAPVTKQPGAAVVKGLVVWRPRAPQPFPAGHAVAFARDGRVAVVHPSPYRVDYIEPNGRRRPGPVLPYQPIRLTEGHQREWLTAALEPRPAVRYSRDGARSVVLVRRSRADVGEPRWPRFLPPFHQQFVWFDHAGILWVQRTTAARQPPLFDLIGRDGRVIAQVRLPAGTKLVGFGEGAVYLARDRRDGLEVLERHAFPATDLRSWSWEGTRK